MKKNELENFVKMFFALGITCLVNSDSTAKWIVLSKTDVGKTYDDELITIFPDMNTIGESDEYVIYFECDGSFRKIEVPEPN